MDVKILKESCDIPLKFQVEQLSFEREGFHDVKRWRIVDIMESKQFSIFKDLESAKEFFSKVIKKKRHTPWRIRSVQAYGFENSTVYEVYKPKYTHAIYVFRNNKWEEWSKYFSLNEAEEHFKSLVPKYKTRLCELKELTNDTQTNG